MTAVPSIYSGRSLQPDGTERVWRQAIDGSREEWISCRGCGVLLPLPESMLDKDPCSGRCWGCVDRERVLDG